MKKELLHIILIALCLPMGLKAQTNTITTATVNLLCSADYNNDHWTYCYPLILNAQDEPVSGSFTLLPDGINATFDYDSLAAPYSIRSEERRVGKECRFRWRCRCYSKQE